MLILNKKKKNITLNDDLIYSMEKAIQAYLGLSFYIDQLTDMITVRPVQSLKQNMSNNVK